MDTRTLLESLLHAEHEDTVIELLTRAGYPLDDDDIWIPLGQNPGNFSVVGNQQENAAAAFVEKVVNSIDAVLMGECRRLGIDPESESAPLTMQDAVEQFFGARGGRLDNLTSTEQTTLADRIHVIATGQKTSPCYCIVDRGEGQTPNEFPNTFLSTSRSSPKIHINFVQGKFNAGGSGSLQFCGQHNIQLVLSRRQPYACPPDDASAKQWGFTIVRRRRPRSGERGSVFVYLAPRGQVLRFNAESLKLLPGKSSKNRPASAYDQPLAHGTCVKLYNFRWNARGTATLETRRALETAFHTPCLPFRISESRDYKANYYSTTVVGVWNQISASKGADEESRTMEAGFPAPANISLRGIGELPIRIGVWKETVDTRNFPTGVYFLVNGQVHGQFGGEFISRRLKFDYIRDHILVSVDCTGIDRGVAEDLFMASRDRLRKNEQYDEIRNALAQELAAHQGLKDLNAARRKARAEKAGDVSSVIADMVNQLIRSDPGLAGLFGVGTRIITSTGPGLAPPFKGRKFPTYFKLTKEPKVGVLKKECPVNRTVRVEFETDAENDYFNRPDDPGEIQVEPGTDLIEASNLWNGKFSVRFRVPWNAKPGDSTKVRFIVSDVERIAKAPFISEFELVATPEVTQPNKPGTPAPRERRDPRTPDSTSQAAGLDLPTPTEVKKDEWSKYGFEGPQDAFRIRQQPDAGYDFFVNVDCPWLVSEMSNSKNDPGQVKHWFIWGLALAAYGMIQRFKEKAEAVEEGTEGSGNSGSDLALVERACDGLARVIIPMFRVLYEGPPR